MTDPTPIHPLTLEVLRQAAIAYATISDGNEAVIWNDAEACDCAEDVIREFRSRGWLPWETPDPVPA